MQVSRYLAPIGPIKEVKEIHEGLVGEGHQRLIVLPGIGNSGKTQSAL